MTIEFHDSLIVGVDSDTEGLTLHMERVFLYQGDTLARQERGTLRLHGVSASTIDGSADGFRLQLEYGRVLDWAFDDGVGRFLVEWIAFTPPEQQLVEWTFRYQAVRWEAVAVHSD
jgi:hypothetical protein